MAITVLLNRFNAFIASGAASPGTAVDATPLTTIIVFLRNWAGGGTILTLTDSVGNVWTRAVQSGSNSFNIANCEIWYCIRATLPIGSTFTATTSLGSQWLVLAIAVDGILSLDKTAAYQSPNPTTSFSLSTGKLNAPTEFVVGVFNPFAAASSPATGAGAVGYVEDSTFTELQTSFAGNTGEVSYRLAGSADANGVTWAPSWPGSVFFTACMATFTTDFAPCETAMNYGHQGGPFDLTIGGVVQTDFNNMKAAGITKIRMGTGFTATTLMAELQAVAVFAKTQGMTVAFGSTFGSVVATAANWPTYSTFVTGTLVPWATANKIDELSIGNEEELHVDGITLTVAGVQANLQALATTVKGLFAKKVSYWAAAQSTTISQWQGLGLGSLDFIGWNLYNGVYAADFAGGLALVTAAFPTGAYIAEWNSSNGITDYDNDQVAWAADLAKRKAILNNAWQIPKAYFFTYKDLFSGAVQAEFGIYDANGLPRNSVASIFGLFIDTTVQIPDTVTKLGVINDALHLTGDNAVSFLNDGSDEYTVTSPAYERGLAYIMENHDWGYATQTVVLTPSAAIPQDTDFDTAYLIPSDCVHILWVKINDNNPTTSNVPRLTLYKIAGTANGPAIVINAQGGPPPPSPPRAPAQVTLYYISKAGALSNAVNGTPTFILALIEFVRSGIFSGLHEDHDRAEKTWKLGEEMLQRARSRYDQQKPKRQFFNSRITATRRIRRPWPALGINNWGSGSGSGTPG